MADDEVIDVLNFIRVVVGVCSFLVLKIAGRGLLLAFIGAPEVSRTEIGVVSAILSCVAVFGLFAAFGGDRFRTSWLVLAAVIGAFSLAALARVASCAATIDVNAPLMSYVCNNFALLWIGSALAAFLLLMVLVRGRASGDALH